MHQGINLLGEIVIMGYITVRPDNSHVSLMGLNYLEVMQYTGIRDRNERDIYEGDIVTIEEHWCGDDICNKASYEVVWEAPMFIAKCLVGNHYEEIDMNPEYIEVIGNKYDNPELINTKSESKDA